MSITASSLAVCSSSSDSLMNYCGKFHTYMKYMNALKDQSETSACEKCSSCEINERPISLSYVAPGVQTNNVMPQAGL